MKRIILCPQCDGKSYVYDQKYDKDYRGVISVKITCPTCKGKRGVYEVVRYEPI